MSRIAPAYIERIKKKVRLSDIIGAALPLKRAGNLWTGCCPFHKERTPSFIIYDDDHYHCFGCGVHGDAITWFVQHGGLTFEEAVERLAGEKPPSDALRFEGNLRSRAQEQAERELRRFDLSDEQRGRQAQARMIWRNARPFKDSLGQTYLRHRGIAQRHWPPTLRFVERAWHGWERTNHPALIVALQDGNSQVSAIQTIFLKPDGLGKAGVTPGKPVTGPMADGAVRLAKPAASLGLAEGVETAMSARLLYSIPVWASLGAARLGAVRLPEIVRHVAIFGDNGERGHAEAEKAAAHYRAQGYDISIAFPPSEHDDFNTMLQRSVKAA